MLFVVRRADRKAPSIRHATGFPHPWHFYTCRTFFQRLQLFFHTSKLPLREQFALRVSLSCDLWIMGVAHGVNLKRWTHLAGAWAEHLHTQICMRQHHALFVWRDSNITRKIKQQMSLFVYLHIVCQMQIESTRHLPHVPLPWAAILPWASEHTQPNKYPHQHRIWDIRPW